jgi:hypothetical protein
MRRYRLIDLMAVVAIVAISMAVGGYLEGLRRDAAKASRGTVARPVSALPPAPAPPTGPFDHVVTGLW